MADLLIALVGIATFICPFALVYVWVIRFARGDSETNRRVILGWSSLVLVSLAVAVYWLSALGSPAVATPEWDIYFRRWSRISVAVAMLGFVAGVGGSGRKRGVVLAASLTVPLSWALTKVLE